MVYDSTVYVYHAGVWRPLSSGKVYHDGSFAQVRWTDKVRHQGEWYIVGPEPIPPGPTPIDPYTEDQYGKFPVAVQLTTYECTADTHEDPETGDTTYSNWRWELVSSERAAHNPELESPDLYPELRYYTLGPTMDYLIFVNPANGHITGVWQDIHNAVLSPPPPPEAGLDYFWDTVTYVSATL